MTRFYARLYRSPKGWSAWGVWDGRELLVMYSTRLEAIEGAAILNCRVER